MHCADERGIGLSKEPTSRLRKFLWMGGSALAILLITVAAMNPFLPEGKALHSKMMGLDFIAFYTAGTFVREGDEADLYNIDKVWKFEQELARKDGLELQRPGPWWNPPFYALVFDPLSRLKFETARNIWVTINLACVLAAIVLLKRMLGEGISWKVWGLLPLLVLVSMPTVQAMSHAQNTGTSLLILTVAVAFWRRATDDKGSALWAGMIAGLLFYKPQLGAVIAGAMVLTIGLRALAGLAITGFTLLAINLVALPDTLGAFLSKLPANVHYMQVERAYLWERHATLKAFWRLLIQGFTIGEASMLVAMLTAICAGALGVGLLFAILRCRKTGSIDDAIAATIACGPLLMPFYFDYDLLLLAIPATLYVRQLLSNPQGAALTEPSSAGGIRLGRSLALRVGWIGLYAALLVNPAFGKATHVNAGVILLTAVASLLVWRAWRYNEIAAGTTLEARGITPLRRAA